MATTTRRITTARSMKRPRPCRRCTSRNSKASRTPIPATSSARRQASTTPMRRSVPRAGSGSSIPRRRPPKGDKRQRLERLADRVDVGAGFGFPGSGLLGDRRIRRRLQLSAHITRGRHAVVHLRIRRDGDLVRQVRRADDQPREAARPRRIATERRRTRAVARLHADLAGESVERLLVAHARDEARAAQVIPPQARLVGGGGAVVQTGDDAVAGACRGAGPAPGGGSAISCRDHATGARIVPRDFLLAADIAVAGRSDPGEIGDHGLDLGLRYHLLALQNAAQQESDDDQNDRDLNQRKTSLVFLVHFWIPPEPLSVKQDGGICLREACYSQPALRKRVKR